MKSFRHIALMTAVLALMASALLPLQAKNIVAPKAYMFGFSASFSDSIVYFTDIQEIDSVWFTQKKKMLAGRSNYSYQLREFFESKMNLPKRTCIVIGSQKKKDVEKKYAKMKKQYTSTKKKAKPYEVRFVTIDEFKFRSINMGGDDDTQKQEKTKKDKKDKKDKKKGKPGKNGTPPPPRK